MTGSGVVCPTYTPSGHSLQIQSRNRRELKFEFHSWNHSIYVKVTTVSSHLPLFPVTVSCSVILMRSEPPTKPMTTFFLSSLNRSSISTDADCRLISALLTRRQIRCAPGVQE